MKRYRVKTGSKVNLKDWSPADTGAVDGGKAEALKRIGKLHVQLEQLQELLYAERRHRVLIVLQAMDTGGKDGAIRRVFEGVNPQGVRVTSFKKPSDEELSHDYLWRIHSQVPAKGEIVIFNRSHYEDVLIVRVHNLAPQEVWMRRFDHINDFERMLADEGVTILKFFLHISCAEQKERLQARLDDPAKTWKFSSFDLAERKYWDKYMTAYEDVLTKTSTPWAP
ncbi:MAG: polyphosphate kinase 2 family protein, partial [Candidatus Sumerlaeota bacterium]|nr:polyphosphate kinase 2 family protein [Candidatus Sumerlaeota bacterium]